MAAILTDIITTPLFKPKTNAQNKAVLDADGKAELLIGDNGLPVLNAQALDNAVDEGRQKLNRSIG
nr:hypothetical protein LVJ77_09560 [Conchiformibius kuhniae]